MNNRIGFCDEFIPAYGTMTLFGMIIVTILGGLTTCHRKLSFESFIKLECIGGVAAIMGAKVWDMITKYLENEDIVISLESYIDSGLSFYGGVILGACFVFVASLILQIDFNLYAKNLIFLVPLLHGIWKIGCFMGGCCYGVPYGGFGSVIYPEGVRAPAGIELFPIQLIESSISFVMSAFFYLRGRKKQWKYPVLEYIGYYSGIRFCVEFFRWHGTNRTLSIAQMTSLVCLVAVVLCYYLKEKDTEKRYKDER